MFLTKQSHLRPRDPNVFPAAQLALLALVRVAEPIALTSIFPYAWKLVLSFNIGEKQDASFYAGILIAAFALAESLTGMFWGSLSDRVGRKPILLLGCSGTAVSLLIVGFSTNFWMALAGRALGGLLNGNIGVIQTMVGELVTLPEHQTKAFAIMPFIWAIGTIIGPAVGGYLCNPSETFPDLFSKSGIFARYPYLLPNLVCASLLVVAITAGALAIEETHPDMQPWSTAHDLDHTSAETPLMATAGSVEHAPANLQNESYGTFNAIEHDENEPTWQTKPETSSYANSPGCRPDVFSRQVVMLITALGLFTYHSMTFDNLFPIFLQDVRTGDVAARATNNPFAGGLGLSTQQVGVIMSFNGIIALFVQGVVFPAMASWLGIWKLFMVVTFGHPITYLIVPFLVILPQNLVYPGIYTCLAVRNSFSILAYPVLLILIKEASPSPKCLGKINGLAASTGAACRTMASPTCGYLYSVGIKIDFTPLAWWASAFIAIIGAGQISLMRRQKDLVTVHHLARHVSHESLTNGQKSRETRNLTVETIQEEPESDDEVDGVQPSQRLIQKTT